MASKYLLEPQAGGSSTDTYYFNASDAAISDPNANWTTDASAFNGNTVDGAFGGSTASTTASHFLMGQGTNSPTSGGSITQVRARIYGVAKNSSSISGAIYTDGLGQLLGTATSTSTTAAYGSYVTLSTPTGGWTWQKINDLEVKIYSDGIDGGFGGPEVRLVEIEVSTAVSAITLGDSYLLEDGVSSYLLENPITDSYDFTHANTEALIGATFLEAVGQSFTSSLTGVLDKATFMIRIGEVSSSDIYAELYAHSGTYGTSSIPTGSPLATSDAIDPSILSTTAQPVTFNFSGANRVTLTAGTRYIIVVRQPLNGPFVSTFVSYDNSSPSHGGNYVEHEGGAAPWGAGASYDLVFSVSVDPDGVVSGTITPKTQTGVARITASVPKTQTGKSRVTNTTVKTQNGIARIVLNSLQGGILSYYKLDEASGTTAADSQSANNATWQGTLGSQWTTGKINGGGNFNGTDNYIVSGGNTGLTGNPTFSMSAWFNTSDLVTGQCIVSIGNSGTALQAAGAYLNVAGSGQLSVEFAGNNGYRTATGVYSANQWNHIVVTKTAGAISTTTKIYLNGIEIASASSSTSTPSITNAPVYIGQYGLFAGYMIGKIDEVGLWNRALTQTEITDLYASGNGLQHPFTASNVTTTKDQLGKAAVLFARTNNQTGKGRVQVTVTQTETGTSRVTVTTTRDQSGRASIPAQTTRNQTGKSAVQQTVARTIDGISRVTQTRTNDITGTARTTVSTLKLQTGVASIPALTTKDQTGKAAVQQTTPRTIDGISRLTQTRTNDQTGLSRVTTTATKPQTGTTRVEVTVLRTQAGSGRVTVTTSKPQTGASRVTVSNTRDITGVASIPATSTRPQTGVADVSVTTTRAIDGISRVTIVTSTTQTGISTVTQQALRDLTGISRVTVSSSRTQTGLGAVLKSFTQDVTGKSRIAYITSQSVLGVSRITVTLTKPINGVSRITLINTKDQLGTGRVTVSNVRTQTGTARVSVANLSTVTGVARIEITSSGSQTGLSRIQYITLKSQSGVARIALISNRDQSGIARVMSVVERNVQGASRLTASTTNSTTGKAAILRTEPETQTGQARIQTINPVTQLGKAAIAGVALKDITGTSRVTTIPVRQITGSTRIEATVTRNINGNTRIANLYAKTTTGVTTVLNGGYQSQTGRSRIQVITPQTQTGLGKIQVATNRTINGLSRIYRPVSVIRDDFADGVLSPLWTTEFGDGGSGTETGGRYQFTLPAGAFAYGDLSPVSTHDLTNGSLTMEVPGGYDTTQAGLNLNFYHFTNGNVSMSQDGNNLYFSTYNAVSQVEYASNIPYNSTTHRFWKITHTGSQIVYSTSADNITYTARYTTPITFATTDMLLQIGAGRSVTGGSTQIVAIDNINIQTAQTSRTQTGISRITQVVPVPQFGKAAVLNTTTKDILGRTALLRARNEEQTGQSRVQNNVAAPQTGKADIKGTTLRNQIGSVVMAGVWFRTISGRSRVARLESGIIRGQALILQPLVSPETITGVYPAALDVPEETLNTVETDGLLFYDRGEKNTGNFTPGQEDGIGSWETP